MLHGSLDVSSFIYKYLVNSPQTVKEKLLLKGWRNIHWSSFGYRLFIMLQISHFWSIIIYYKLSKNSIIFAFLNFVGIYFIRGSSCFIFFSKTTLVTLLPTTPPNVNWGVGMTVWTSNPTKFKLFYINFEKIRSLVDVIIFA